MLDGLQDYMNTAVKKAGGESRIDPGTFSLGETGWFLLHAGAIAGVYLLGSIIARKDNGIM